MEINIFTTFKIVPILFFISGCAGLIYEVIWKELLINLVGSSSIAVTIILASFMLGLSSGSLYIGKKADNWEIKKIVNTYILVEIFIGIFALLFPSIISLVENSYISLYNILPSQLWSSVLLKSFFCILILFIPTFLMGTTLPLITKFLSKNWDDYSKNVSLLYGLNTFGAILGTLIAGFYLLENYGISGATYFSAFINFFIALIFFIFFKKLINLDIKEDIKPKAKKIKKEEKMNQKFDEFSALLLISYFISGAASMFYQVSWTRALSLVIGTSTYSFTIMLATFLIGISIGSLIYRYISPKISRTKLYLFIQFLIVISIILTTPLFEKLPIYFLDLTQKYFESWSNLNLIKFSLSSIIILFPTICMGVLFPIVCDLVALKNKQASNSVGKTYAFNAIGAAIGAIFAGLAVIPIIGIQYAIYVGVFLNILALLIILLQTIELKKVVKYSMSLGILGVFIFSLLITNRWNPKIMNSGVYVYSSNYHNVANKVSDLDVSNSEIWEAIMNNYDLLYYEDGLTDSVAVMKNMQGIISLMVNGKVDASAKSELDIATQLMIGQLPLLLHKNPKDVFLVGYASGITAGSILTHPIEKLDAAEISKSVVDASKLFEKYNYNPLDDPRMNLQIKDARHMLMVSQKKYDVIVSQPSNPWIKGQSSLFSYDWYKIVNEHLNDDGIFMQWLPAYSISEKNLKIIINTLNKSFNTLTLWSSSVPGDLIILASKMKNFTASYDDIQKKLENEKINNVLKRAKLDKNTFLEEMFLKENAEIEKYLNLDKNLPINSDDKLITQYTAPKNMVNNKIVEEFIKPNMMDVNKDNIRKIIYFSEK